MLALEALAILRTFKALAELKNCYRAKTLRTVKMLAVSLLKLAVIQLIVSWVPTTEYPSSIPDRDSLY